MKYKIYKLIDPTTKEIKYVGQTTNSLLKRLVGHLHEVYNRTRVHRDKQVWINSLLENNLTPIIELIEETGDLQREEYWIKCLTPPLNLVFNNNQYLKDIISDVKSITVYQYDLNGNFIREWKSCLRAAQELELDETNLNACAHFKRRLAGGFVWRYYKEDNIGECPVKGSNAKEVHRYTLEGKYIESYRCARDLPDFKYKVISKCCLGKSKTYNGYRFSFDKVEDLGPLVKATRKDKGTKKLRYSPNLEEIQDSEKEVINPQENLT